MKSVELDPKIPQTDEEIAAAGGAGLPHGAKKVTKLSQLPPDKVMIDLIKQAVALNAAALRPPRKRVARPMPTVPPDLARALKKSPRAAATFAKAIRS